MNSFVEAKCTKVQYNAVKIICQEKFRPTDPIFWKHQYIFRPYLLASSVVLPALLTVLNFDVLNNLSSFHLNV